MILRMPQMMPWQPAGTIATQSRRVGFTNDSSLFHFSGCDHCYCSIQSAGQMAIGFRFNQSPAWFSLLVSWNPFEKHPVFRYHHSLSDILRAAIPGRIFHLFSQVATELVLAIFFCPCPEHI